MSKIWKAGDVISFAELNALQEKADKYDKLMAKSEKPDELSRQQVVDAVLMGRFLERFGDHSTSVARRMTYLVSGTTAPVARDGLARWFLLQQEPIQ